MVGGGRKNPAARAWADRAIGRSAQPTRTSTVTGRAALSGATTPSGFLRFGPRLLVAPLYPRPEDLPRFVTEPEIVTIPDQGHVAVNYAPFEFAGYVLDFIGRH